MQFADDMNETSTVRIPAGLLIMMHACKCDPQEEHQVMHIVAVLKHLIYHVVGVCKESKSATLQN